MDLTHWSDDPALEQEIIECEVLVPQEQAAMLLLMRGYRVEEIARLLRMKEGELERLIREAAHVFNEDRESR